MGAAQLTVIRGYLDIECSSTRKPCRSLIWKCVGTNQRRPVPPNPLLSRHRTTNSVCCLNTLVVVVVVVVVVAAELIETPGQISKNLPGFRRKPT